MEFLTRTWSEIKARSEQRKAPSLLHRDLNLVERILRDYITPDFGAIWVDTEEEYTKVVDFMSRFQPQLVSRVKLYTKETPVFEEFGIQQEIDKGLRPKVWLKSGGYIVINHTEALVAIDVNTGKFVGKERESSPSISTSGRNDRGTGAARGWRERAPLTAARTCSDCTTTPNRSPRCSWPMALGSLNR